MNIPKCDYQRYQKMLMTQGEVDEQRETAGGYDEAG